MANEYKIDVPQSEVDEMRRRLDATRWPDAVVDDDSQGTAPKDLRKLIDYWRGDFDWRAVQQRLNGYEQVMANGVHAITAGTKGATPLLLLHGWPDSFLRFEGALAALGERFEIVVPSIPGYGFSERPTGPLGASGVADKMAQLMTDIGHDKFVVHGADIGSGITDQLGLRHPEQVIALHFGDVPMRRIREVPKDQLSEAEQGWYTYVRKFDQAEGGYSHLQATKPQTLAASLNDSPAGLGSWILEKFTSWSDSKGDVFEAFSIDDLAANMSIYWLTQTAGSAARYYFDGRVKGTEGLSTAPTGVALFPKDIAFAPQESVERWYNLKRFTRMPEGGHFGPWEQPAAWSAEVLSFADDIGL